MDSDKWQSLLLNWIGHTGLLSLSEASVQVLCIEETDIRKFYVGLLDLLKIPETRPRHIPEFLKANYPDFELSSSGSTDDTPPRRDFVLIYSIFLHYGCVTCLNKTVQSTSQSLSAGEQLAVSVFLNHFLSRNVSVTRSALALAIRDAVQSMDAGPLAKFYAEDENGNRGGDPNYSTPKTAKLEQNFREIYRLRGQVDSVDYEKNYLEGLLREKDIQIVNLKQREADLLQEADDLKKTILYGGTSTDSEDHRPAAEELARKEKAELRQLRKSNGLLEDKVSNLLIEVNNVTNDKLKLAGKLKLNAKELKAYRERECELATLIEELNGDLAEKGRRIGDLLETNMELESYISENKSLWNKNIDPMNTSSMSTYSGPGGESSANDSSTNLMRSANLASCIIDIQLKEKELENAELKAQLVTLNDRSRGLKQGLERFLEENAAFREQCNGGCGAVAWPEKIPEFFQALTDVLREKSQLESTAQGQITVMLRFREERDRLKEELAAQTEKYAAMEKELTGLRDTVKAYAETERKELDTFKYEVKHLNDLMTVQKLEKESFKSAIEKGEEDVYAKIRKISKLNLVIEKLRFEKKKAEHEHLEGEANLNRLWGIKLEEAKARQVEVERRLAEAENGAAMRQKHIELVEETRDQLARRNEELRLSREDAERRAKEREDVLRREVNKLTDSVERLEREAVEMKRENANLSTKMQILSKSLKAAAVATAEVDKGKLDTDPGHEKDLKARRSSLLNQWTSTPRLSMKQKVRLDVELMKRRRISLLSPDDEVTSSESENNAFCTPASPRDPCICRASIPPLKALLKSGRDSLVFNHSPGRRRRRGSHATNPSKACYDRTAINRLQKLKRQKIFNKARGEGLRESETGVARSTGGSTQLESLMWDAEYDLLDLEGQQPGQDFGANNDEKRQNFHEILQLERCDGEDLFSGLQQALSPREMAKRVAAWKLQQQQKAEEQEQDDDVEEEVFENDDEEAEEKVSIERRADEGEQLPNTSLLRNSFERSGASTIQSKSYSMNSGVYWGSERIPTASVVNFSPRSTERVKISPTGRGRRMRIKWDLNVIPMSQQNLLQLIAIVLIGILLCVVYQSLVY